MRQWATSEYHAWCAGNAKLAAANDNDGPDGPITRNQAVAILHARRTYYEGVARRWVQEEAEDTVSDVVVWMLEKEDSWTVGRVGYLANIVRLRAIDRHRTRARRRAHEAVTEVEAADVRADPEWSTTSREELLAALTRITTWAATNDNGVEWGHDQAKTRAAILANVLEEHELTSRELAAALGLSDSRIRHLQMELRAAARHGRNRRR